MLTTAYYGLSEIACAAVAACLLRLRLFGDAHDPMLERAVLPEALEIDSALVTDMVLIGGGGYGAVFRATYRGCSTVAVKKIHMELEETAAGDAAQRKKFVQEAIFLCQLKHPNIVQARAFGPYCPAVRSPNFFNFLRQPARPPVASRVP